MAQSLPQQRPNRTLGVGHDEFWAWCNKGELRLQRCNQCNQLAWPVVQQCECCTGAQLTWERMSGRGKVISGCTFERDYYAGVLPIPWETILVELEEGPLFLSNPVDFTWQSTEFNMPVQLNFVECEDQAGVFQLPVFSRV
jgi:uncharacterized protein